MDVMFFVTWALALFFFFGALKIEVNGWTIIAGIVLSFYAASIMQEMGLGFNLTRQYQ